MSLANRCDRCGALIPGEANFEKENFDLAIMVGSELRLSYEDLCPNCSKTFNTLLASFEKVEQEKKKPAAPKPKVEAPVKVEEVKEVDMPEEVDEVDEVDEEVEHIERPLANKVVKKIPVEIKRPNER